MRRGYYLRMELIRSLRNRRFLFFALGFPLVLYYVIAGSNKDVKDFAGPGLSAPLYYMLGLTALGMMTAMLSSGGRISVERQSGWTRQLRLTPMRGPTYVIAKVAAGYLLALLVIAVMFGAGLTLGVRLEARQWAETIGLLLVGAIPFAGLGIFLGHKIAPDSLGPAVGGGSSLLAMLGGAYFPLNGGTMETIASYVPSYWLVQASHVALGQEAWPAKGWAVVAAWSVAATALAARAYRTDTKRI
ncbi:MAG: transporter permease [Thermoleophilia bacterium]|nr:transporter permease [Thermoleophilia bacterium]